MDDYTNKYKGGQVEIALYGGDYQASVLTRSTRRDAPDNDWPPQGLRDTGPEGGS